MSAIKNAGSRSFSAFPKIRDRAASKIKKEHQIPLLFSTCFAILFVLLLSSPSSKNGTNGENRSFIRGEVGQAHDGPVMHTYIGTEEMKNFNSEKEMEDIVSLWQMKWEEAGWKAVVLNEKDAKSHSQFFQLKDEAGIHRWMAMSAVGGVWFADFRTFPLRMDPMKAFKPPNNGHFTVHDPRFNVGVKPTLISGLPTEWDRMVDIVSPYANKEVMPSAYTEVYLQFNTEKHGRIIVEDGVVSGVHGAFLPIGRTELECPYYGRATAIHLSSVDVQNAIASNLLQIDEKAKTDAWYIRRILNMLAAQCPIVAEG